MKKSVNKHTSVWLGMGIGVMISVGLLMGLICVLTSMVLNETLTEGSMDVALCICIFVSVFVGSMIGSALVREGRLMATIGTGIGSLCVLMIMHVILFAGEFYGVIGTVFSVAAAVGCTLIIEKMKKGRIRHSTRKYRFG